MAESIHNSFFLPLEGVDSEHCAMIVDRGISKVEGITAHKVELNNRRAVIQADDIHQALPHVIQAIRNLGYEVSTQKKTLPVLQMTCASCAASVERILRGQAGVASAAVNFASATVLLEYVPGITDLPRLKAAVQAGGYDLLIEDAADAEATLAEIHAEKFKRLRFRTIGAVLLSIPLVVIGMFFMDIPFANYIMWALASPVVLWLGKDFFVNAWKQARNRSANMDTLVALSTGVAYGFSVFNTLFPDYWHTRGLHAHVYFESAAVVVAFILLGKMLEEKAKGNTSAALQKLIGLQPKTVTVLDPRGNQHEIQAEDVQKGYTILVKPGEKIAVDGTVLAGESYVDESMMSGEPLPVLKTAGEKVFAGTLNQKGSLQFHAEKVGSETMLAQIIRMVQDAQGSKAPVQRLVDKIAGIFVPVVIALALLAFAAWWIFGGENGFTMGLMSLVTVLVIACPCALGLATPTAIIVGVGKGAEQGILIKDAESLELAKGIQAVVLDKTGTITEGKPVVMELHGFEKTSPEAAVLFSIESQSEHPLAAAIVQHLKGQGRLSIEAFESITGQGARAVVEGKTYFVGNARLLEGNGISISPAFQAKAEQFAAQAQTTVWFADATQALALIAVADQLKPSSAAAIQRLRDMGIDVYMLTGDNEATARVIAQQTGITDFRAGVLPQEKAEFVKKLQAQGKVVAMVGDGINDSTALAQADVGIAMGQGADIAMDVAKMTIISSDLNKIPQAIRLSRQTVGAIRQNLFWAFIYNLIGIPIAAGVLYPFTHFLIDPMIAGAAMALSSVSVVGNSLRLKLKR